MRTKLSTLSIKIGLFTLFIGVIAGISAMTVDPAIPSSGTLDKQPIAFSHKSHSGKEEIACLYCHIYAERSSVAGVPSVQKCIGCHKMIAIDDPEVQKLLTYWDNREPIPWIKIYNVPDFVYFSHRMHLNAEVACEECHGNLLEMDEVKKVSSLSMGWCLECHKKMKAPIDCNVCHK